MRAFLITICFVSLSACNKPSVQGTPPQQPPKAPTAKPMQPWVAAMDDAATQIIKTVLAGNDAMRKLTELCDGIGHRLSGSKALDLAIAWAAKTLKRDGHENVRTEKVMVPHWERGEESAWMVAPYRKKLYMLGLGGSVGTGPKGVEAEVVVVSDKKAFDALSPEQVRGKILLFNAKMPPFHPKHGTGYGTTVKYRYSGAKWAAAKGGVAALVRSVTAHSLRSPHTGMMSYGDAKVKVPTAAISTEDADQISRMVKSGKRVVVRLQMSARDHGMVPSANVLAELRGREKPEEIVVIGGHIDSWDVGQGAHDDGAGCVIAMEALTTLRRLKLIPRRTIRVVLFTNEENGLRGGKQYAIDHKAEVPNHVAAIEADTGAFKPTGFSVDHINAADKKQAAAMLAHLAPLLRRLGATDTKAGWGGADISPLKKLGVPVLGQRFDMSHYFDYHHTHADTLDKVKPEELTQSVAAMAVMAYALAEMPGRLVKGSK